MTIAIPVGVKVALAGEVTVPVQLHTERNSPPDRIPMDYELRVP